MILLVIILALAIMFAADRTANRDKDWLDTDNSPYYYQESEEAPFYDPYGYEIAERRGTEYDLFFDADGKPIFVDRRTYK